MSFTNDSVSDSELYVPDFSLVSRKNGHTQRRTFPYREVTDSKLEIYRYTDEFEMIPVTDVDDLFSEFEISNGTTELTLSKANKFNDVRDALEMYSTSATKTFDSKSNMDKTVYDVPVVGFVKGYISQKTQIKKDDSPEIHRKERFIIIDDHKYSCDKTYKPHAGMYIPLVFPSVESVCIPEDSQYFRLSKNSFDKDIFTCTLPIPFKMSGFSLRPEIFKYEKIHSTAFHCDQKCKKDKHCINVLANNPGFVKRFELSFRSPETGGKWIELGKFDGSNSIFSHDIITFDETLVKEFRINVIEHEGNIEKIRIEPFGKMISSNAVDESSSVTYTLYSPRDGHYVRKFDKRSDYVMGYSGCDCAICRPHAKAKGVYKKKCQMMHDVYSAMNDYY